MSSVENCESPSQAFSFNARMQESSSKWSHLIPSDDVKSAIDNLIPFVLESREKMEQLITLICKPENISAYANYAHMMFACVFRDINTPERNKLERMLDVIADRKGSGGITDCATFLMYYDNGRYDDCFPE